MTVFWRCTKCGRRFAKRNQWHSCVSHSIKNHFRGKPEYLRRIFDRLVARLRRLGAVRVDAVKSSINLASKSHFGAVRVLKNSLNLGFLLDRKVESQRILRTEKVGERRFGHSVKLSRLEDVDEQLMEWMKEAYSLSKTSPVK